jgi:hypothetical protein
MVNKKACFILLASLIITSLFGCGSGGGAANLDASTSSNGDQTSTSSNGDQTSTSSNGGQTSTSSNGGQTSTEGVVLTLAWYAPTTNTDGSSLNPATDLSQYKIYYGTASLTYTTVVNVTNPGTTTISKTLNLSPGTYYFSVTTVDAAGLESDHSNEVMKTI